MPTLEEQQALAETLVRSQIENSDNVVKTLPYWEAYKAIISTNLSQNNNTPIILTDDSRELTIDDANEDNEIVIPAGRAYIYLTVLVGPVVMKGMTFETDEFMNLEPVSGCRHPAMVIQISSGKKIRMVGAY